MEIRLLIFQFFIVSALFSAGGYGDKVFFRADVSWCLNLECNPEPYSPITHPVEEKCELNTRESYIEGISTIHYIRGDFPDGDSWQIQINGPKLDNEIVGRSDNYVFSIMKGTYDGEALYSACWNSVNRSLKVNWPLGEDYTFVEGYPPDGAIKNTGRFTLRNETCEFILDFAIPKILEKVDHRKEFEYADVLDVLCYPYTNIDYTLNTYYLTIVLDDKIDELLEERIAGNAKWIDDIAGGGVDWAKLNKTILETQKAWKEYAKLTARENYIPWGSGTGAPSAFNRAYIRKQVDRINELKLKLK